MKTEGKWGFHEVNTTKDIVLQPPWPMPCHRIKVTITVKSIEITRAQRMKLTGGTADHPYLTDMVMSVTTIHFFILETNWFVDAIAELTLMIG